MPDRPLNENDTTRTIPSSQATRRAGLILAGLILFALLGSLVFHLMGRSQYSQAVERFQEELSSEIPDLAPEALRAQVASFAPPTLAEPENAARWLIAGSRAMVLTADEKQRAKELSRTPISQWTAEQTSLAQDLVERNRGGIETMYRATPLNGSNYGVEYDDFIDAEIPNLLELLNAAHLLNLATRLAFAEGNVDLGLSSLKTLGHLTATLRRETILIFALVAHVTERLQLQAISEILISTEPWGNSPEVLAHLESLMAAEDVLAFSKKLVALDAAVVSAIALEGRWNIERKGTDSRLRAFYFGHRHAARYLDQGRLAAALAYKPFAEAQNEFSTGSSPGFLGPEYRNALAKGQLLMSQRHLVKAALAMRRLGLTQGAYLPACPALEVLTSPDPMVGQTLLCQPQGDGSLHLEIPGAAEVFTEIIPMPTIKILEIDLPAPHRV